MSSITRQQLYPEGLIASSVTKSEQRQTSPDLSTQTAKVQQVAVTISSDNAKTQGQKIESAEDLTKIAKNKLTSIQTRLKVASILKTIGVALLFLALLGLSFAVTPVLPIIIGVAITIFSLGVFPFTELGKAFFVKAPKALAATVYGTQAGLIAVGATAGALVVGSLVFIAGSTMAQRAGKEAREIFKQFPQLNEDPQYRELSVEVKQIEKFWF